MRVAVFGASGYTGLELLRLLLRHPHFEIALVTSEQRAGEPVGDAFPPLRGRCGDAMEKRAFSVRWVELRWSGRDTIVRKLRP
mgnify:CR=1 FL=1